MYEHLFIVNLLLSYLFWGRSLFSFVLGFNQSAYGGLLVLICIELEGSPILGIRIYATCFIGRFLSSLFLVPSLFSNKSYSFFILFVIKQI